MPPRAQRSIVGTCTRCQLALFVAATDDGRARRFKESHQMRGEECNRAVANNRHTQASPKWHTRQRAPDHRHGFDERGVVERYVVT